MNFFLFDLQAVIYKNSEEEKDQGDGPDAVNGLRQNKNSGALRSGAAAPHCSSLQCRHHRKLTRH